MRVVTSGARYLDIDAYAGCMAYAELLNLQGQKAIAATTAPLNESVTPTIRGWSTELVRDYQPSPDDMYVLIDISDPEFFDTFVVEDRVDEIIDHHMEFADYWQQKIGDKSQIEFVGAACTLVYERWRQSGELEQISETSARLLIAGILDNTLNFEAVVTTDRDRAAYDELSGHANLPENWQAVYFEECQQTILSDLIGAIRNDVKQMNFPSFGKVTVGQLVVWDGRMLMADRLDEICSAMAGAGDGWFMSVVSISEGRNYLIPGSERVKQFLEKLSGAVFNGSVGVTDRLWLRKEIMKRDLDDIPFGGGDPDHIRAERGLI